MFKTINQIKPINCVLGFGIPTSKESFFKDQNDSNKDFAKMFDGVWSKYYYQFVKELEIIEPQIKQTGLEIIHNYSLSDFHQSFDKFSVIVLFSHWKEDKVEFSDGLKNVSEIVEGIPNKFNGIIDLCVCHPVELALLIRSKKPNCLVRYTSSKSTPIFWLHFYLILFNYLKHKEIDYLKALEDVIFQFKNITT